MAKHECRMSKEWQMSNTAWSNDRLPRAGRHVVSPARRNLGEGGSFRVAKGGSLNFVGV